MSLTTRLQALATRIADEFKAIRVSLTTGLLKATRIVAGSTTDNGVHALQVNGDVLFTRSGPTIFGNDATGTMLVYANSDSNNGAAILLAGSSHPTKPNVVDFLNGGLVRLRVAASGSTIVGGSTDNGLDKLQVLGNTGMFGDLQFRNPDPRIYGNTDAALAISAKTSSATGASIILYASGAATYPHAVRLISGNKNTALLTANGNLVLNSTAEIGTATERLQVNGHGYIEGNLRINSNYGLTTGRLIAGTATDNGEDALQVGGNIAFSEGGAEIKLAVDVLAQKPHFFLQTSSSQWAAVQSSFAQKAIGIVKAVGNSTTLHAAGIAISGTGTATSATTAATNVHTATRRLEYAVTTASATAVVGFRIAARHWHRGGPSNPYGGFFLQCKFGPSRGATLATRRNFVGMASITSAPTDVEPDFSDMFGVCTRAADTNWQIMHRYGSNAIQYIDTGMAKSVTDNSEMYQLFLWAHPDIDGVAYEFIRLSDGATVSGVMPEAHVPPKATLLCFQAYSSVGGTSSVIGIALADLYIESDY